MPKCSCGDEKCPNQVDIYHSPPENFVRLYFCGGRDGDRMMYLDADGLARLVEQAQKALREMEHGG